MGRHVAVEVPDVGPVPIGDVAVDGQALVEEQREKVLGEVDVGTVRDEVQHLPFQEVDPGIDRVAEDVSPPRFLQESLHAPLFVRDDDPVLERVLHLLQRHGHGGAPRLVKSNELGQVDVGERVPG